MKASRRSFLAAGLSVPLAKTARSAGSEFEYRTLGKTGLKVTSVGFGCMITSDQSVVEKAAEIGITYFDTARGYQSGNNERMVGAALRGRRKNLVLSSKTGARTKQDALNHLDTSLRELQTDFLDIWYLHNKSRATDLLDELLEAQNIARKAGKIRFAGVSTHGGQKDVMPAAIKTGHFDVILTSYNFSMNAAEMDALIADASRAGIGIVAMKVMAGGFRRVKPGDALYSVLKRDGAMLAALKWALRNRHVGTTIPSMTDMDQLDENLRAMSSRFNQADEKMLARQLEHIRPLYCRMCGSCDGACPRGLPVSDVLRYLAYADGYGQFSLGRERFMEMSAEQREVRCGDCTGCSVQCPNGVRVSERLIRAQELFA
jgi:predicted aldo/keto reductase-like oxidoreductase